MNYNIDVYHLEESNLPKFLNQLISKDDKIQFNFINQTIEDFNNIQKHNIIIFEEENYLSSIELFQKIIQQYNKPASIIVSSNKEIFNVVQWIRKGATDYLVKGDFNKENFINTINGSLEYISNKKKSLDKKIKSIKDKKFEPICMPKNFNWDSMKNNESYELSLVMIEIILRDSSRGQYSKSFIDEIYLKIRNEIKVISNMFGGKLWYWNNNTGVVAFYFGDKISCSVLSAIYFYIHFFQICLETLKLNNVIHFKIGINEGHTIFNYINTGEITSNIINSLTHLTKKHTDKDSLNIASNVYKKLNPRIKKYFIKLEDDENNDIYQYQFFNYPNELQLTKK